ncbi:MULTISPECIES: hypothetical protein [Sphingobacterium]|uniref:Tetratricopeptide repeat protein n=1 Tax=Sphingobacterium populi TaxID=1812824 RepID=A0ABW5UDS5_9SPHI|nr:hypothetical protein [Sphingobacterium sp. CFCC 11742]
MNHASTPNIKQLFATALREPDAVSEADFQVLLSEYPFAQALVFAYQCRKDAKSSTTQTTVDNTVQKALIHTDNRYWLYDLIEQRAEIANQEIVEEGEILASPAEQEADINDSQKDEQIIEQADDELADLILEQVQSSDYFALESAAEESTAKTTTALTSLDARKEEANSEEDLSVYDDALMPYSFRWWLYKTRQKHADTYQPFVNSHTLTTRADGQFVPSKFDETILDHQIRENIFHLQNPEDKLSAAIRQKTVEVSMPKKTDAVIERFIREEPQIQPPTPDVVNNENKARKSAEDHFSLVTETLANIYIEQGLYPKAADVFRKLISINPEKKAYFASRIEELEQKF